MLYIGVFIIVGAIVADGIRKKAHVLSAIMNFTINAVWIKSFAPKNVI